MRTQGFIERVALEHKNRHHIPIFDGPRTPLQAAIDLAEGEMQGPDDH